MAHTFDMELYQNFIRPSLYNAHVGERGRCRGARCGSVAEGEDTQLPLPHEGVLFED